MVLGLVLMVIGAMLVYRNRDVAMFFGREPRINQWGFYDFGGKAKYSRCRDGIFCRGIGIFCSVLGG